MSEVIFSSFKSKLISSPGVVVDAVRKAILERKLKDMDKRNQDDFLLLVCEWIEWIQDNKVRNENNSVGPNLNSYNVSQKINDHDDGNIEGLIRLGGGEPVEPDEENQIVNKRNGVGRDESDENILDEDIKNSKNEGNQ